MLFSNSKKSAQRQILWKIPRQQVSMLFVFQGAGHNDVELYNQYLERLKTFVAHELTN